MKIELKQRIFSFFDSYDINDEYGNKIFSVSGRPSFGHYFEVYDNRSECVATVRQKFLKFRPKFEIYIKDEYMGYIQKELTFFKPSYTFDFMDWKAEGEFDLLHWNYRITDRYGNAKAYIEKQRFKFPDTYTVDIAEESDTLPVILLVLSIDAVACSNNNNDW